MHAWFRKGLLTLSKLSVWWLAGVLYVLALALPAVEVGGHDLFGSATTTQDMSGFACLGTIVVGPSPAWANIALGLAIVLAAYQKPRAAVVFTLLAVVMAASTLLYLEPQGHGLFALRSVRVGFWFWLASCVVMLWARFRELSPPLVVPDDVMVTPELASQSND